MNDKLKGVYIEVLTKEHGKEVIEFFKNNYVNTTSYTGEANKEELHPYRYYGMDLNGYFSNKKAESCKTILTLEQAKQLVMEDKKQQTLTRAQLKELYDAFNCSQWRTYIMQLLTEHPFDTHINISSYYVKLLKDDGSKEMIAAVKLLGIVIEEEKWVRVDKALSDIISSGQMGINNLNKHRLLYNMTSWAEHHNKIDGFVPNWTDDKSKFGIAIFDKHIIIFRSYIRASDLLFSIAVLNEKRANEMLAEFESDIKKIKW